MNTVRIQLRTYRNPDMYDAIVSTLDGKRLYKSPVVKSSKTAWSLAKAFVKTNGLHVKIA